MPPPLPQPLPQPIDRPELDAPLARLLHAGGRLPLDLLQGLLGELRAGHAPGTSLARLLLQRGLLDPAELEACLVQLGGPGSQTTRHAGSLQEASWQPGSLVGGYRLVERLGAGGMGVVFLAEHPETGGRYALKALTLQADPELLLRFQREADSLARVDGHPNVVRVHTAGKAAGRLYLVMELASEGDLAGRLKNGPLPPREAATLVRDLARGLAHVHANGVWHRDLKPQNVVFDEGGVPKLVDFGLARLTGTDSLTQTGEVLGTPAYMAPEQAEGRRCDLGPQTDVYGLGAVLYAALSGSPPFQGTSTLALLAAVCHERPAPPSSHGKPVPAPLEALCLRCLAKDPAHRFPSATALAEALTAWLEGRTSALSSGLSRRLGQGLLLATLLLGVAAGGLWAWPREAVETVPATPPPVKPLQATGPSPETLPSSPLLPTVEERLAALAPLEEIPPPDLPLELNETWRQALLVRSILLPLGQGLQNRERDTLAARCFKAAAEVGVHKAWVELAYAFFQGEGVPTDSRVGWVCLERAIQEGSVLGVLRAGEIHHHGQFGTPVDLAEAVRLYRHGLSLENDEDDAKGSCAYNLGRFALAAEGLVDPDEARLALKSVLDGPSPNSQLGERLVLAKLLLTSGAPRDALEAQGLLQTVARHPKHPFSSEARALLSHGPGLCPSPLPEQEERLAAIATMEERPPPVLPPELQDSWQRAWDFKALLLALAQALESDEHYAEAATCYEAAAAAGYPRAWTELADLFEDGRGVPKDLRMTLACFQRAAREGSSMGALKAGDIHYYGAFDTLVDYAQAAPWFRLGLQAEENDVGSRANCAVRLGRIALRAPEIAPPSEAVTALRDVLAYRRRRVLRSQRLVLAQLLLASREPQDLAEARELLEGLVAEPDSEDRDKALTLLKGVAAKD